MAYAKGSFDTAGWNARPPFDERDGVCGMDIAVAPDGSHSYTLDHRLPE